MIGEPIRVTEKLKYYKKILYKGTTYALNDTILLQSDEERPWVAIGKSFVYYLILLTSTLKVEEIYYDANAKSVAPDW